MQDKAIDKLVAMDDAGIDKAIAAVQKKAETVQLDIQNILVAVAIRWAQTGDVRLAVRHVNNLIDGLPLGIRRNALREYVEAFFMLQYAEDGDMKGKFVASKGKTDGKHLLIKDMYTKRWFDFKPEPAYKPIDFAQQLDRLLARAGKADESKGDKVDAGLVAALAKAKAEYYAATAKA